MFLDTVVEIPKATGKVTRITKNATTYIYYEYARVYDPVRKFNIPKRKVIGKQLTDDKEKMFPNENFQVYFPNAVLTEIHQTVKRSCSIHTGAYIVLKDLMEKSGVSKMIRDILGKKDGGLFLDLAAYSIICEDNAAQYYPDYAYNHPLFSEKMRIYSDSHISAMLSSMREEKSAEFLNRWNDQHKCKERIYISYDSTNKNCAAGDIEMVEYGHPKVDAGLPIFNCSVAYDRTNRIPLFYEEYPGSIVDVSQLQYMLEKAKAYGYNKAGFILDRGYFSKDNIQFMDENEFQFVIMTKGMGRLTAELIHQKKGTFENVRKHYIRHHELYGTTIEGKLYADDQKNRFFHLFYSSVRAAGEQRDLERMLNRMATTMDKSIGKKADLPEGYCKYYDLHYDKEHRLLFYREKEAEIERLINLRGYFVIITSEKMSATEALDLYKSRDDSEKLFRGDKSYLGSKSMRVQSDEAVSAKLFIEFVALITRNKFYTNLWDAMKTMDKKPNFMTVPAALKELDKIELGRQRDGHYRLDHAVTATQKTILAAFGLDEEYIRQKASEIGKQLYEADQDKYVRVEEEE